MTTIIRPGQRIVNIPGIGLRVSRRAVSSGAANWWSVAGKTTIAAYQPKGAADYAASKVNLDNPGTHDATDGSAPTWSAANGWSMNNNYLITDISSATKPVSILARVTPTSTGYRAIVGDSAFPDGFELRVDQTTNKLSWLHANTALIGTSTSGVSGDVVVAVTYSGVGAYAFYQDGSADGSGTVNVTFSTSNMHIGRQRAGEYFYGDIMALALYSDVLTPDEVATVSAAMAAL